MRHVEEWLLKAIAGNIRNNVENYTTCKERVQTAIYSVQVLSKTDIDVEALAVETKKAFMECKLLRRCEDLRR